MNDELELKRNILITLLRTVVAITPIGKNVTYLEDTRRIDDIIKDPETWLDLCSALCDLLHDYT